MRVEWRQRAGLIAAMAKRWGFLGLRQRRGGGLAGGAGSVAVSLLFVIRFLRVYKLASGCHGIPFNY